MTTKSLNRLSPRELQILRLVAGGMTNAEAARALGISVHTVRAHMRSIAATLDVHNRTEMSAWAWRSGIAAK